MRQDPANTIKPLIITFPAHFRRDAEIMIIRSGEEREREREREREKDRGDIASRGRCIYARERET